MREKDCVSSLGDTWTSLCQAMEFFAHCLDPQVLEQGVLDGLPVVCNCLLCDRVYYAIAVFFNFDDWICILILGKTAGDCDGKGVSES